ncbi:unnamed protein product [Globisporangium polare]
MDDAHIAKNAWTPIALPLVNQWTWRLGMTTFQVDRLSNASAELFPAPGGGTSAKKKSSATDNSELVPQSPKTRNTIVVIAVVLALLIMAVSAYYRHKKRKQHAAKMTANDAAISTPVASSPATGTADAAPYQTTPFTDAAR